MVWTRGNAARRRSSTWNDLRDLARDLTEDRLESLESLRRAALDIAEGNVDPDELRKRARSVAREADDLSKDLRRAIGVVAPRLAPRMRRRSMLSRGTRMARRTAGSHPLVTAAMAIVAALAVGAAVVMPMWRQRSQDADLRWRDGEPTPDYGQEAVEAQET